MKEDVNSARVIGVMSGSSLDGIDLALCHFAKDGKQWSFTIEKAVTVPYDGAMHERLLHATGTSGLELARLHRDIGIAIGNACHDLLPGTTADLIASHGHQSTPRLLATTHRPSSTTTSVT